MRLLAEILGNSWGAQETAENYSLPAQPGPYKVPEFLRDEDKEKNAQPFQMTATANTVPENVLEDSKLTQKVM